MANLMRPGMYNSYHHITVPAREGGERHAANVVGTLCENNDWFAKASASHRRSFSFTRTCVSTVLMTCERAERTFAAEGTLWCLCAWVT